MKTTLIRAARSALRLSVTALTLGPAATGAWGQGPSAPPPGAGSGSGLAVVLMVMGALLAILVAAAWSFDVRRRRAGEAARLQARIADALLTDRMLAHVPLTPTAHLPFWRGSPVTIEVAGPIPSADLRAAALHLIVREAGAVRWDFRIEDRMRVVPATLDRAA